MRDLVHNALGSVPSPVVVALFSSRMSFSNCNEPQSPVATRPAVDSNPTLLTLFHRYLTPDLLKKLLFEGEQASPSA